MEVTRTLKDKPNKKTYLLRSLKSPFQPTVNSEQNEASYSEEVT